jgi:MFS family permease
MPEMAMPVLFKEISEELNLSLVQIGTVWGIYPLGALSVVLIGGMLGDRFAAKYVLGIAALLAGVIGALRGISGSFATLTATMFLFGIPTSVIATNVAKTVGMWFPGPRLALAQGVAALGMALGFFLGAMISATVLSPFLGGWRNVLFLYSALSIAIGIIWLLTRSQPSQIQSLSRHVSPVPFHQVLSQVARLKGVWLLALILLGHVACVQGMLGYLPLHLREIGWTAASADGAAASFHVASMIAAIPMALLSNRLGSRKIVILVAMLMTTIGVSLLSVVGGTMVCLSVILAGIVRDGFMAVLMTALIETEGVGTIHAGTALGLTITISRLGSFISPPIGNSLANVNPGYPFIFWAAFAFMALVGSCFLKETGQRGRRIEK